MQLEKEMDVVFHSIYTVKMAFLALQDAVDVDVKLSRVYLVEDIPAVFCPEDQVV
jgi:hypothetical protein